MDMVGNLARLSIDKRRAACVLRFLNPTRDGRWFSVYNDVRDKLVDRGIPSDQIAFAQDFNDDASKAILFKSVREGSVRVLLGSTAKMGEGTNVQRPFPRLI